MAALTWVGGYSGGPNDWDKKQNWSTGVVPTAADSVVINAVSNQPILNVNASVLSLAVGAGATLAAGSFTVTVANTATTAINLLGSGSTISLAGGRISDAGGVTLAAGSGITGFGTLSVTGHYAGTGSVSANGGTLAVGGTINSGVVLSIGSATASNLAINGTATSLAAVAISSANQTLTVGPSGALTISVAESISNGAIVLAGGTLTDTGGLTIGSGATLSGFGTVAAALAAGSGAVTASGGTLLLKSAVASGNVFAIASSSPSMLQFNAAATSAAAIAISNANQTLAVGPAGALTIGAAQSITNGQITMAGGTLTDASGLTIGAGATLSGAGSVVANIATGSGTITASGGTLTLKGTVASGNAFTIGTASASTLQFNAAATAAAAFIINNVNQTLAIGPAGALTIGAAQSITNGKITMTGSGTLTDASGLTIGAGATLSGAGTVTANLSSGSGTITASSGTLTLNGSVASGNVFTIASATASTLKFGGAAISAAAIAINSVNQTLAVGATGALTIGAAESITNGKITLAGGTLTDAGGLTIDTGATLSGFGTVAAAITTGAGTITASGGTLALNGVVASGNAFTISASSTLQFNNTARAAAAIAITTASQTLAIGPSGSLTIGAAESITNGKITLAGGLLIDSSGLTIGTGATLSGFGRVIGSLAAGAGTVTASGGVLALNGTVASGNKFTIASTTASTLQFNNSATSATAITINNANQTLAIGSNGALTIGAAQTITNGKIALAGGTLTDASGMTLGAGARLTGYGTLAASFAGVNTGSVTADSGVLALTGNIAAASGLTFNVTDNATSVLKLGGTVGARNTIAFAGSHGAVELGDVTIAPSGLNFAGTVSNLRVVSGSASPDLGSTNYVNVQATITKAVLTDSTHIELFNGTTDLGTITLGSATSATTVKWFDDAGHAGSTIGSGTDIVLSDTVCFAAGTRILTAGGERAVETLAPGDAVITVSGDEPISQRVKWVGRRRIDLTAHPRPKTVAPVRIERDAFADGVPHADLLVSPDHAIFVDGRLIAARQLMNGTTIRQELGWTAVEYIHVELDAHAILLAEGLPAESYLDTGNRGFFADTNEPLVLHPNLTSEADCPVREAASCAPFVWDEASVRPVWQRLADRAAARGKGMTEPEGTRDAALHVWAGGRRLQPVHAENGRFIFALPRGVSEVLIGSRSSAPADLRPWLDDRRVLGVCVDRVVLRDGGETTEIALDDPALAAGWWAAERASGAVCRWTNGRAVLPLRRVTATAILEIRVRDTMAHPVTGEGSLAA